MNDIPLPSDPISNDTTYTLPEPGTPAFSAEDIAVAPIPRTLLIVLHLPIELAEERPAIYQSLAASALVRAHVIPFPAAISGNLGTLAGYVMGFDRVGPISVERIMRALHVEFGAGVFHQSWWHHLAGNLAAIRETADEFGVDARAKLDGFFKEIGVMHTSSTRAAARRGVAAISVDSLYANGVPDTENPNGLAAFVRGLPIPTAHVLVRIDPGVADRDDAPHTLPSDPSVLWTSEIRLASVESAAEVIGGCFAEIAEAAHVPEDCARDILVDIAEACQSQSA